MRRLLSFLVIASLAACSGGSGGGAAAPQVGTTACEVDGQKQFVLDNLYAWYLWNDLLPTNINIANYTTAEDLIFRVTREFGPQDINGNPIDLFSFINTIDADAQFFGEGRYEGFGFSYKTVDQAGVPTCGAAAPPPLPPLAELAPELVHPVTGKTMLSHWQKYNAASHPLEVTDVVL